jgi:hypothetical protein
VVSADITKLTNPTVRAWESLFEADARLFDDGSPRSLSKFTQEAVGHERFTAIDRVDNHGLDVTGEFHSETWGDFRTYFRFQLSAAGRIKRLDIGEAD